MRLFKRLERLVDHILEQKVNALTFVIVFLGMLYLRCFIEQFIAQSRQLTPTEMLVEFIHNLYFFLLTILLSWIVVSLVLKMKPQRLSYLFAWATWLMILPPILDMAKTGGQIYWSFYIVGSLQDLAMQFITIFGHFPSGIVYFGTRITFILAIIGISAFVAIKTRNIVKTIISALGVYIMLFFMGAFPSLLSMIYFAATKTRNIFEVQSFNIVQFLGAPQMIWGVDFPSFRYTLAYKLDFFYFPFLILLLFGLFFLISREKLWAVLKNFRYPQIVYHSGLFLVGMGLGYLNYPGSFNFNLFSVFAVFTLLISIWLAWMASVVVNDISDLAIDQISNPSRPLPKKIFSVRDYTQFGIICFLLSLLGAISVGTPFFMLILAYQIIAWFYSAYPLRLKRFPGVATAVSALASLLVMFLGYILMSNDQSIHHLSWRIIVLLFLSYTFTIPVKDFKDIEGDGKDGVWTVPVLFGEKNGRLIVAVGVFVSYMLSVFLLNELRLFWWAMLSGIAAFLALNSAKIKPRKLPGVVLSITAVYGLILVWVMFM